MVSRLYCIAGRSKWHLVRSESGTLEAYSVWYVESGPRPRTKLEASFSGLLEVPCQATHDEARIARHKMDVIDAAGLIAQS